MGLTRYVLMGSNHLFTNPQLITRLRLKLSKLNGPTNFYTSNLVKIISHTNTKNNIHYESTKSPLLTKLLKYPSNTKTQENTPKDK